MAFQEHVSTTESPLPPSNNDICGGFAFRLTILRRDVSQNVAPDFGSPRPDLTKASSEKAAMARAQIYQSASELRLPSGCPNPERLFHDCRSRSACRQCTHRGGNSPTSSSVNPAASFCSKPIATITAQSDLPSSGRVRKPTGSSTSCLRQGAWSYEGARAGAAAILPAKLRGVQFSTVQF
jgi:hypothetical protein